MQIFNGKFSFQRGFFRSEIFSANQITSIFPFSMKRNEKQFEMNSEDEFQEQNELVGLEEENDKDYYMAPEQEISVFDLPLDNSSHESENSNYENDSGSEDYHSDDSTFELLQNFKAKNKTLAPASDDENENQEKEEGWGERNQYYRSDDDSDSEQGLF